MPSFYKNGLNFRPTKPYTDKTWIGKSGIRSLLLKRDAHSAFYCQAQKWAIYCSWYTEKFFTQASHITRIKCLNVPRMCPVRLWKWIVYSSFFKCFEYQELYIPFYKYLQGQIIKDIFHVGMLRKLERAIIGTCTLYDSTFGSLVEVYLWNLHIMS